MSKRAEELARQLTGLAPELYKDGSWIQRNTQERLTAAIALIDAELRKEREQAATKAIEKINTEILFASIEGKKIEWPCTPKELRAAILDDEED